MKKLFIILILLTLLAVGCKSNDINQKDNAGTTQNADTSNGNAEETQSTKAEIAPDFELESLDGTKVKLSSLKGKNVLINFWATWCGPCVKEMPDLQKLQDEHKDDDFVILAVNVGDKKEQVQKFVDDNKLTLMVLLDLDSEVGNMYGLRSFPSTITVNKKGEIVTGYVGMLEYDQMQKLYNFFEQEEK